jgi:hypothetical protein
MRRNAAILWSAGTTHGLRLLSTEFIPSRDNMRGGHWRPRIHGCRWKKLIVERALVVTFEDRDGWRVVLCQTDGI